MKSLRDFEPYRIMYVDAMNLLSRSHYGMPSVEYKGKKTGMLLGVVRLIFDWRQKNSGLDVVFIWEGRNSWRKKEYPIYKAHRRKQRLSKGDNFRKEFQESVDIVKEVLPLMDIRQVSSEGFEADDTVWTLIQGDSKKKLFVSTDWDWWGLSDYGDILYYNDVLGKESLEDKFSSKFKCNPIPMSRMWLFKALTGDISDNISGIPRFPKKIAAELSADLSISEHTLLKGMESRGYDSWAKKTTSNWWIFKRNLDLIRVRPPLESDLEWVEPFPYNKTTLGEVLLKYGMSSMHDRLVGGV